MANVPAYRWLIVFAAMPGFEVQSVADHHDAIEGEARFRALPSDELIDSKPVYAAGTGRGEAVEHR